MQLGAQEEGGRDDRHEHGQEESEDVQEGVPLHQHKLSLHQETKQCEGSCKRDLAVRQSRGHHTDRSCFGQIWHHLIQ